MAYSIGKQSGWIRKLLKGYLLRIGAYIGLEIVSLMSGLSFVYFSKQAVDIATGNAPGVLRTIIYLMIISIVLGILSGQWASWLNERVKIRVMIRLQNSLVFSQMQTMWENAKRWHTGDLLVRMTSDTQEVVQMCTTTFPNLCVTGVRLLASWGFLWMMDPFLAGMILAISPLFLFSKLYYRKMRKLNKEVKDMESSLGIVLQENLKQRLLIRALGLSQVRKEKYRKVQAAINRLKSRLLQFTVLTQLLLKFTFNGGYLLAFMWGVYRLHAGIISFGTLTAFLQLVGRIQVPVLAIIAFVPAAIRCRTALDRLMELYEGEREEELEPVRLGPVDCLKLTSLSFRYEDRKIIDGLTAELFPGIPVAVVGATGKGKTTLIRLILALVKPEEGRLTVETNGKKVALTPHTRINFSYVPQGNTLFCGSIRENLLLAAPSASDERLKEALELACAEFVYVLPQGIDTRIGESGQGLSEGQAQRIAIARALLHGGNVWLLDEATSALDTATADRLVANLLHAGQDKIIIFVTHDPRLMAVCPQTIRLDGLK